MASLFGREWPLADPANSGNSRPSHSRNPQQHYKTHRRESQQLQVIRRSWATQRHIGCYQNGLLVIRRIVMHRDRRPLRMLIDPLLHLIELDRWIWIFPHHPSRRGRAVRMNVGHNVLPAHGIADAAVDPICFGFVGVDIQAASLDARRRRWPLRLGVFHPALRRSHQKRKHRAQRSKQPQKTRQQYDVSAPLRQILRPTHRRHLPPHNFHSRLRTARSAHKRTHNFAVPKVTSNSPIFPYNTQAGFIRSDEIIPREGANVPAATKNRRSLKPQASRIQTPGYGFPEGKKRPAAVVLGRAAPEKIAQLLDYNR